jgi:radical SAM/Cys-rich protein
MITFDRQLTTPLTKKSISILQINLGKKCNLACAHCHVEASPLRTEEMSPVVCDAVIELIRRSPDVKVVDLTGGAPEMLNSFKPIVEAARAHDKQAIVRSNLAIYFVPGFEDIPKYCAAHQVRIVASLPCYLADNVDKMRGKGVYDASISAIALLNELGYGRDEKLILDLVYNPPIPSSIDFRLTPDGVSLSQDYKRFLKEHFNIYFNDLLTITNLPIGRTQKELERRGLDLPYLEFLAANFNPSTTEHLMCRHQLSIDYLGNVYDCDFNQMTELLAQSKTGENITVAKLLAMGTLDAIDRVQTADYCYGCTAGSGSSCGGALV